MAFFHSKHHAVPSNAEDAGSSLEDPYCDSRPIVVLDMGAHMSRIGYAGSADPLFVLPTVVSNHIHAQKFASTSSRSYHDLKYDIGQNAYEARFSPQYFCTHPVGSTGVTDWDCVEQFWHQTLFKYLRCTPETTEILFCEPPFFGKSFKQNATEVFMEVFNCAAITFIPAPILASHAAQLCELNSAGSSSGSSCAGGRNKNFTAVEQNSLPLAAANNSVDHHDENSSAVVGFSGAGSFSSSSSSSQKLLSGGGRSTASLVVDVGYKCTRVIPVLENRPLHTTSEVLPYGGHHVTEQIYEALLERREQHVPPNVRLDAAEKIKLSNCYVAKDPLEEMNKYFAEPGSLPYGGANAYEEDQSRGPKITSSSSRQAAHQHNQRKIKTVRGNAQGITRSGGASKSGGSAAAHSSNNPEWACDVGPERFLSTELFFSPDICLKNKQQTRRTLPECIVDVVKNCPIDYRRQLYGNIVLCGGTSVIKHFPDRLARDVSDLANRHSHAAATQIKASCAHFNQKDNLRKHAVWFGGSMFASKPATRGFYESAKLTRDVYADRGNGVV
ncbi:unnamed protein product [Amoebophrya sp. A120]|nr:unnamed protein product [Amoebophrya sp. A120]|eukprot:GSA120T00000158001.1